MKRRLLLLASVFMLASGASVWADSMPTVVDATTLARTTRTVFNDSGGALTSGSLVVWDNDDTEFDRNGYPYVTTVSGGNGTTSIWAAGITTTASCPDQALCEIVTEGPVIARVAHSTQAAVEDTTVSTSSVAGQVGDWDGGAGECSIGIAMELREAYTGATTSISNDNTPMWIYVHKSCED